MEKCLKWIHACGRTSDFNTESITKHTYISLCTKHFVSDDDRRPRTAHRMNEDDVKLRLKQIDSDRRADRLGAKEVVECHSPGCGAAHIVKQTGCYEYISSLAQVPPRRKGMGCFANFGFTGGAKEVRGRWCIG